MFHKVGIAQLGIYAASGLFLALAPLRSFAAPHPADERTSLYESMNREWLIETVIPADKPAVTYFSVLQDTVDQQLKTLLEKSDSDSGSDVDEVKLRNLYRSFLDIARRNDAAAEPIEDDLDEIDDLDSHEEIALHFATFLKMGVSSPVVWVVGPNFKNSDENLLWAAQSGLGLPARAMYLGEDDRTKSIRAHYERHLASLFRLAELSEPDKRAKDVLALETALATIQWAPEQLRDYQNQLNIRDLAGMQKILGTFPVAETLQDLEIPENAPINAAQLSYLEQFGELLPQHSVESWKNYLRARLITTYSSLLSDDFHAADVEYQKALGYIQEDPPRWKQAIDFVQACSSMLTGKVYVASYFDQTKKEDVRAIVDEIKNSAKTVIGGSKRLSPETRQKALVKLDAMTFNIGYPDTWPDFSKLHVDAVDVVENFKKASEFELRRNYRKLLQPVDRSEWERSPHEVNAAYDPTKNKFVLHAAILQPPFFDSNAGVAAKYGGIGFVIGHEMGHAFDDSGSQFDSKGNLANWWTDSDRAAYDKVKNDLIRQADAFQILPGVHLNGRLQIGEIMGDVTGATLALRAFDKVIAERGLPTKESHRAFFRQLAQVWREKLRPEIQQLFLATDPHPPGKFRTDGVVCNMPAFHSAFETKPGDAMYRKPSLRTEIW